VCLQSNDGKNFKGFMIQARRVADDSAIGKFFFNYSNNEYQPQCDNNVSIAMNIYLCG